MWEPLHWLLLLVVVNWIWLVNYLLNMHMFDRLNDLLEEGNWCWLHMNNRLNLLYRNGLNHCMWRRNTSLLNDVGLLVVVAELHVAGAEIHGFVHRHAH